MTLNDLVARIGCAPTSLTVRSPTSMHPLWFNLDTRQVQRGGEPVHLTPTEFKLLADVWGPEYTEHTHYLRLYMAQLRAKIERDPAEPRHLLTETGVGYRLAVV